MEDPEIWVAVIGFAGVVFSAVITYAAKVWRDGPGAAANVQRNQNGVLEKIAMRLDDMGERNHTEHEAFLKALREVSDRNAETVEKLADIIAPRRPRTA